MDERILQILKESRELSDIVGILEDDLQRVIAVSDQKMEELKDRPARAFMAEQQTWFRLSNRIVLSTIESICFKLKQIALLTCGIWNRPLTVKQREKLEERDTDGNRRFLPVDANVKFTFEMYAYAFDCGYRLDCSRKEWEDFLEVVAKRNAITHPKSKADLKMTVEDHSKAADTYDWFISVFNELMKACRATGKKMTIGA